MHFLPEELTGLPESSDRRGRVRRNPSAIAYLDAGEGNGGIVLNVSETGMAVAVAQALTDDEIPVLTFRLPHLDRTFQAGGQVIWRSASKKSAGVRFVNLEERDRSQIRNWIRAEIVEAELKAPVGLAGEASAAPGSTATPGTPAKTVLVMPSRAARKAASQRESEAERDQARAAEFDRMFPSEADLAGLAVLPAPAANDADRGEPLLAFAGDHDDVELAAEAFRASLEPETETEDVVAENAAGDAVSDMTAPANHDWREEWEQFHIEREKLEKLRSSETSWELPRAFSTPLPEAPIPAPELPQAAAPVAPTESDERAAEKRVAAPEEKPGETVARKVWVRTEPAGLDWYRPPMSLPSNAHAEIEETSAPASEVTPDSRATANPPKTEKDALSIAALCTMLVLMCFILGYAIQPGSFRFSSWQWGAAPTEAPEPSKPSVQPASDQIPSSSSPARTEVPSANPPSGATATGTEPAAVANNRAAVDVAPKTATSAAIPGSAPVAANHLEDRSPVGADRTATANRDAAANTATGAGVETGNNAKTDAVNHVGASTENGSAAAASAGGSASPATTAAVEPVSFFPVTAPSEGSPAKMMVLPEETILQTRDILIRSHQFLFVPPLPGAESTHELERVHLGDRIARIDPGFAPQSLENFQGSSIHLRSTIGADGRVEDVRAISGPTSLIPAAVNAVRQWRYKPTDIDGKPIAIEEDIVIEVRPSHS
jgi:PilZ domain/Gram-negative bacterial TonB protein C-terminal